ncbi:MAG: ABC transporter ATP-binding protein [Anaerolineales bacterium]|nr:MAG: ABC transporter ATP-binding protein [Anaerolineales bacterium]
MSNIVETFSLTKRFSQARNYRALLRFRRQEDLTAVDSVTLQIREGELFGLLGSNGAGKTTLIKMLCTLILPSEGRALVCGQDVVAEAAAVKPLIGLVDCQERSFFWRLSGRQNLEFFAALYGLRGAEADERIAEVLALVELGDQADHRFMGYSTGMRQKLAVARGLLVEPRVIFMDEPTRSLDPVIAHDLRTFIRETLVEKLGRTVVLVTHRLEEAEELCDRVAIMNHGRIIACGPVAEIKKRIPVRQRYHLHVQHLPPQALDGLRAIPGVVQLQWAAGNPHGLDLELVLADEKETLPLVMRFIVSHGGDIQHCQAQGLSLEEAFVHLVRGDRDEP